MSKTKYASQKKYKTTKNYSAIVSDYLANFTMTLLTDVGGRMVFHQVAAKGFNKVSKGVGRGIGMKGKTRAIIDSSNKDTLKHIFRNVPGHLKDTPANRKLLESIGNNPAFMLGKDIHGNTWYAKIRADGNQIWVRVRGGMITNGGINNIPRKFHPQVGLCAPKAP